MRKIVFIIIILILTGCGNKVSMENNLYNVYVEELQKANKSSEDVPFNINVELERVSENEVRYVLSIDEFTNEVTEIEAIVIHNYNTEDVFPSVGIFDKKINSNDSKGILLIGYISYSEQIDLLDIEFKALIKLVNKEKISKTYTYIRQF